MSGQILRTQRREGGTYNPDCDCCSEYPDCEHQVPDPESVEMDLEEKEFRTLGDLVGALNDSETSLAILGPGAEIQILLEDEQGREVRRYAVNRFLPTSKGNLVLVVDV